jgi:hypothetical protein
MIGERTRGCPFRTPPPTHRGLCLAARSPAWDRFTAASLARLREIEQPMTDGPTFGTVHGWVRGHGNVDMKKSSRTGDVSLTIPPPGAMAGR